MTGVKKYIGIGIITIIAVVWFSRTHTPPLTELEVGFNTWYEDVQQSLGPIGALDGVPNITISLKLAGSAQAPWTISTKLPGSPATTQSRDRVARLLQLTKEGRIFGLSDASTSSDAVQLEIVGAPKPFKIGFSPDAVHDNIQAQNLLKLFQVYATQPAPSAPIVKAEASK